jgi:hypothetical protein
MCASPWTPVCKSTSVIRTALGREALTRTRTVCFASTSRKERTSRSMTRPSSTPSQDSSTIALDKPSPGYHHQSALLSRCGDHLKPRRG